jgi:hypothetical protein
MEYSKHHISFLRLSTLILEPGANIVRWKLYVKITHTNQTFVQFLGLRKHDIFHLYQRSCCLSSCKDREVSSSRRAVITDTQWQTLFLQNGTNCKRGLQECACMYDVNPSAEIKDMDLSFSVCFLVHLFPLTPAEKQDLKNLRNQRNYYFAHSNTPKVDTKNFSMKFQEVASTIESLANSCGHETWKEYKERIQQIKDNPVSDQNCRKNSNPFSLLNQSTECNQEENQAIKVAQYLSFYLIDFVKFVFMAYGHLVVGIFTAKSS